MPSNLNTQTQAISGYTSAQALPDGAQTGDYTIFTDAKASTAQVDRVSSTTLTNITGLSVNVLAGATYIFEAYITGTSTANGGAKFAIGGTATATSVSYTGSNLNGTTSNARSTTTTLGNAVGASTAVFTNGNITGAIVVATAGTLTVQIAQNASHADTTSAYINSSFLVTRVS
jgi:hypothetical protein